jgi:hypothetical protein
MLKVISEFVIKVADLAEAEGRQLRAIVVSVAIGLAMVLAAALVSVVGLGLLVLALYSAFETAIGPAWSACVSGAIALAIAGISGFIGWRAMTRGIGPRRSA